ncbi:MAG: hypothetical protein KGJ06_00865 [Pseudomonadota bacterium]|nr:hypothetical protein [Pseudomonadota bacterium]
MSRANTKKLAFSNTPTIEAVTEQALRLASEEQAIEWLEMLEHHFIVSRHQIDEKTKRKSLILWIKGYEVTKEEKAKGYLGNFAAITYKQVNNKWTLYPTKMYVELAQHPQRKYQNNAKHPNWGHPILRSIQKKKTYETIEAAEADLMKLHEQFPMASIPAKKRFYLMIFSRDTDRNKPVKKYVFEIKVLPEGGFYIDFKLNDYQAKQSKPVKQEKAKKQAAKTRILDKLAGKNIEKSSGYFASMVELKRKKKK